MEDGRWLISEFGRAVYHRLVEHHVGLLRNLVVHLEENGHASDIVNVCVVLAPFLSCRTDDGVAGLLGAVPTIEWPYDARHSFICEEFPDAVRCDNYELVFRLQLEAHDFRVGADADRVRHEVSE